MSFSSDNSTPNQGLSATRQAPRELGGSQVFSQKRGATRLSPQPELPLLALLESPQSPAEKRGGTRLSQPSWGKPQIQSCPGVPMRQRDRYRVVLGDEILGEKLTIDEALSLAKRGKC